MRIEKKEEEMANERGLYTLARPTILLDMLTTCS